jgi:hypothetical protein
MRLVDVSMLDLEQSKPTATVDDVSPAAGRHMQFVMQLDILSMVSVFEAERSCRSPAKKASYAALHSPMSLRQRFGAVPAAVPGEKRRPSSSVSTHKKRRTC